MDNNKNIVLSDTIPLEFKGKRLDAALALVYPQYSRERIKSWITKGECLINGQHLKPKEKVTGGEKVEINAEIEVAVDWSGEENTNDYDIDIIYQDKDVIVINKPSNLVVHPGAGNPKGTLVNILLSKFPELNKIPRAGVVHRLDKDTTGLMVIARNLTAHANLVEQLEKRTVKRIYDAIVWGIKPAGSTIDAPIGRHGRNRTKMAVAENGKEAITHFKITEKFRNHMLINVSLETGRTHQIRVHMTHINHPLVGDKTYGRKRNLANANDETKELLQNFPRQALNASKLGLIHPTTKKEMQWEIPLPKDMQDLIIALREDVNIRTV